MVISPCKFCGAKGELEHEFTTNYYKSRYKDNYVVRCTTYNCFASKIYWAAYKTKEDAIEAWNRVPAVEPAQSVPAFWASENILKEYLRDNISCVLTTTKCAANTMPLYTVPPAIDETRHKLILVCEYLETVGLMFVSPRVISSQIRAILEAGNGE